MEIRQKIRKFFCKHSLTRPLYTEYIRRFRVALQPNEVGVICRYNLGETYLFCSMLDSFKETNGVEKVVMITDRKYHREIYELFKDRIDRYCIDPGIVTKAFRKKRQLRPGRFFFVYDTKVWKFPSLAQSGKTFLEMLRQTSGIAPGAKVVHPPKQEDRLRGANDLFESLGLKRGKTVLLSPEAKTCDSLGMAFCEKLCDRLKERGWEVFLNTMSSKNLPISAVTAFLPLSMAAPFSELCEHVIAIRSGFCDLISDSAARFHVLYPDAVFKRVYPVHGIVTSASIQEYVIDEMAEEDLIRLILDRMEAHS